MSDAHRTPPHAPFRRRAKHPALIATVTVVLAAVLAACGSSSGSGAASGSGSAAASSGGIVPASLTVPTGSVSASQGAFQYTLSDGFFAKNGLTVTTPLSAEGQLKSSFVAGSVHFDQLAGGDVLDLYANNVGIKVIGCVSTNTGYFLYGSKGISSVQALKGKTVGVPSLGGAPQVAMEAYLVSQGMQPNAVKFVSLGSIPNVLTALTSKKIDSGLLSTPFNFRADAAGLPDLGYATGPPTPYVVNAAWAKQNPTVVTEILKSLAEGSWSYQTNESAALTSLGKFLSLDPSKPADKTTLSKSYAAYLPPIQAPVGRCSVADFTPYVRYQPASEQAALKNLTPLIDNSYIDALDTQGFYAGLQKTYGPLPKGTTLAQVLR